MLTEKEFVLDTLRRAGKSAAVNLQAESLSMTGTELCAAEEYIPDFQAARAAKNMLERKAGQKDGFVCRSSACLLYTSPSPSPRDRQKSRMPSSA